MNGINIVIAVALVALVFIFIRISWTLKEICDVLASRDSLSAHGATVAAGSARTDSGVSNAAAKVCGENELDETEIAAVIAIASQAMRAAS
jgi:hypothetical protein